jgi:hypothetical protein
MSKRPFHLSYEELPGTLPIFPLTGALLLPEGRLPLNVFEPRYLAMIEDALGARRLVGMIQPSDSITGGVHAGGATMTAGAEPALYEPDALDASCPFPRPATGA